MVPKSAIPDVLHLSEITRFSNYVPQYARASIVLHLSEITRFSNYGRFMRLNDRVLHLSEITRFSNPAVIV